MERSIRSTSSNLGVLRAPSERRTSELVRRSQVGAELRPLERALRSPSVVRRHFLNPKATRRYRPSLAQVLLHMLCLKAKGAEALFLNTQTEEALAGLARQLRELAYAPKLYGAYLSGSADFLMLAGTLAEGLVFV